MSSVSGLSVAHREVAKQRAVDAALLGLHHAPAIHYTQGAQRWEGIAHQLHAAKGQYPHYADCSAFVTWCLWNGLHLLYGCRDVVNGENWTAGFTGTLLTHGKRVAHETHWQKADAALYGQPGTNGEHTALYVGGGMVISHGSEQGPFLLPIRYRPDLLEVRRYV